ncbi:DUF1850 domain-containing protein [Leucobacter sp. NPDC015123]|uniref:DUF1850 domain-containing protein n=1 Tax=Leucobacter sp. NPDC015123 TaxID=3364129 RepID=UPI0036F46E93
MLEPGPGGEPQHSGGVWDPRPSGDPRKHRSLRARSRDARGAAILVGVAILAGVAFTPLLAPTRAIISVTARGETGGAELIARLPATATVTVSYVHSIDGLPVEEELAVREGEFVVERTRLRQFGAGMGHQAREGSGHAEGPWWVLEGLERPIGPELTIRAGKPNIDHRLWAGERELLLSRCWPRRAITLEIQQISLLDMARGELRAQYDPRTQGCAAEEE